MLEEFYKYYLGIMAILCKQVDVVKKYFITVLKVNGRDWELFSSPRFLQQELMITPSMIDLCGSKYFLYDLLKFWCVLLVWD